MESYLEQYEAREGGVTLHTWTDVQGEKRESFYMTSMPSGAPYHLGSGRCFAKRTLQIWLPFHGVRRVMINKVLCTYGKFQDEK